MPITSVPFWAVVFLWALSCAAVDSAAARPDTTETRADPTEIRFRELQSWDVDPRLFGRFFEHNGKDAYPGLYSQHLANGSFEPWYVGNRGNRRR